MQRSAATSFPFYPRDSGSRQEEEIGPWERGEAKESCFSTRAGTAAVLVKITPF